MKERLVSMDQIRSELRRLIDRKKALIEKQNLSEEKIRKLKKLTDQLTKVEAFADLETIVREAEVRTSIKPGFFKTSKYLVEKDLQQATENEETNLEFVIIEIRKTTAEIESEKVCPNCQGTGVTETTDYVREDNIVQPVMKVTPCQLCQGKGRIEPY